MQLKSKHAETSTERRPKGTCRDGVVIFKDLPHLYNMSNSQLSCVFLFLSLSLSHSLSEKIHSSFLSLTDTLFLLPFFPPLSTVAAAAIRFSFSLRYKSMFMLCFPLFCSAFLRVFDAHAFFFLSRFSQCFV